MLRQTLAFSLALLSGAAVAADTFDIPDTQARSPWAFQLSGTAQHFREPRSRQYLSHWNQENWGVGIQYDDNQAGSPWSWTYSAGSLRDSFGVQGGYAGIAQYHDLFSVQGVKAQAGVGLFLLWRALDYTMTRKVLLVPLPVAHIEHERSGLGLNFVLSPTIPSTRHEIPGFLFIQATARF